MKVINLKPDKEEKYNNLLIFLFHDPTYISSNVIEFIDLIVKKKVYHTIFISFVCYSFNPKVKVSMI